MEIAAAVLSGAVALPELQPVFETALILAWAYLESLYDVRTLLAGGIPYLPAKSRKYSSKKIFSAGSNSSCMGKLP